MPLPLLPIALIGAGLYFLAKDDKSGSNATPVPLPGSGGGGGMPGMPPGVPGMPGGLGGNALPPGALPGGSSPIPADQGGGFLVNRDGVQVIRPDLQPAIRAQLAGYGVVPQGPNAQGDVLANVTSGHGADQWVGAENARGRVVLMSTTLVSQQAPAQLLSVAPGRERALAPVGSGWAVLAEPGAGTPVQPAPTLPGGFQIPPGYIPQGLPGGSYPSFPGGGAYPGTAPAGPNAPASYETPNGTPYDPGSIPGDRPAPPQSFPAVPGAPPIPGGIIPPGYNIPGYGGAPASPTPASPGMPAGPGGATPGGVHIIRSGDTAGSMAVWYTGEFQRVHELPAWNPGMHQVGDHFEPWKLGQQVILPAGWDMASKGPMPAGWFPHGTGGGGGGGSST